MTIRSGGGEESETSAWEMWDGVAEVGRIEVDIAKHLDPRISITVLRIDSERLGQVQVSMA